jgi:hypothetical protein
VRLQQIVQPGGPGSFFKGDLQLSATASRYRCWLKNHVEPKWRDYPIEQIKPLLVEDWLKKLDLAPKSKSHLKNLMRVLF